MFQDQVPDVLWQEWLELRRKYMPHAVLVNNANIPLSQNLMCVEGIIYQVTQGPPMPCFVERWFHSKIGVVTPKSRLIISKSSSLKNSGPCFFGVKKTNRLLQTFSIVCSPPGGKDCRNQS